MKIKFSIFFLLLSVCLFAQKPCDLAVNVTDSIGTLKETKPVVAYEKIFGGKTTLIFLSLVSANDIPVLKIQHITKSKEFETPKCFDKSSRIIFQLSNGKIYTFVYAEEPKCDELIYNETEKQNNRFAEASFLFLKDNFEDLKKFPISFMRIRFAGETIDYVIPKELDSETLIETYNPADFFIDNFNCIAN
ncbi:hypothetical protein [Flavobacterium sp. H122]|uniref:hypothetical protein n=1 Tax=Flavobacterium sp. H122 TaxID=2529860 RepID=UPI0010A9B40A|nr:hypothetical protein [Flavobacterium sp. H122]